MNWLIDNLSVEELNPDLVDGCFPDWRLVVVADGLNEFDAGDLQDFVDTVINALRDFDHENLGNNLTILLTDRLSPRGSSAFQGWDECKVDPIDAAEVERLIDGHFKEVNYRKLRDSTKELLSLPGYLQIALNSENPDLVSAHQAFEKHFREKVHLDTKELDSAAQFAFEAYRNENPRSFPRPWGAAIVGENVVQKMLSAGVLDRTESPEPNDKREWLRITHQLNLDYLASRYLVQHPKRWGEEAFDSISLRSNTLEGLEMTFQQTSDETSSKPSESENLPEEFVRAVYDWNWIAVLDCMSKALQAKSRVLKPTITVNGHETSEIEFAVLVLVALKRFDRVKHTVSRATKLIRGYGGTPEKPAPIAAYLRDLTEDELRSVTASVASNADWFGSWQALILTWTETSDY